MPIWRARAGGGTRCASWHFAPVPRTPPYGTRARSRARAHWSAAPSHGRHRALRAHAAETGCPVDTARRRSHSYAPDFRRRRHTSRRRLRHRRSHLARPRYKLPRAAAHPNSHVHRSLPTQARTPSLLSALADVVLALPTRTLSLLPRRRFRTTLLARVASRSPARLRTTARQRPPVT